MGTLSQEPLSSFVGSLANVYQINTFVETGTYLGVTAAWASSVFPNVKTIECSDEYYKKAKTAFADLSNVEFIFGDSATELLHIVSSLTQPALFWLDAHAGAGFFGEKDRCPLLDELKAINQSDEMHCILIDDARAFTAPPPKPFDWRFWPPLDQVIGTLKSRHDYYVVVIHDTIIAVPQVLKEEVVDFCQRIRPKI